MEQTDEVSALQPDLVLPCQLPDLASWPARAHAGRIQRDPYRKLILAILEQAVRDAKCLGKKSGRITTGGGGPSAYYAHYQTRVTREAREWFASRSEAVMSFRWCVLALGYEPPNIALAVPKTPVEPFSGPGVGQCP